MHDSSIATPSRRARDSGRERPAWRMNHTGVWGTGSDRAARRKAESWTRGSLEAADGTASSSQVAGGRGQADSVSDEQDHELGLV